jgi:hypothetical protein
VSGLEKDAVTDTIEVARRPLRLLLRVAPLRESPQLPDIADEDGAMAGSDVHSFG